MGMTAVIAVAVLMLGVTIYAICPVPPSKEDERKELELRLHDILADKV